MQPVLAVADLAVIVAIVCVCVCVCVLRCCAHIVRVRKEEPESADLSNYRCCAALSLARRSRISLVNGAFRLRGFARIRLAA